MSLAKTLIKVAIGVAVAKGVSTLMKGGALGGTDSASDRPRGVEDILEGIGGGRAVPGIGMTPKRPRAAELKIFLSNSAARNPPNRAAAPMPPKAGWMTF